jgi:signal transduction histidine kinase
LHAALDNIVRNALRYGGEGSIEVTLASTATTVDVVIRDHGPGVPAADLERIFEPFYRVEGNEAARVHEGTGIGLAVAAKAVELHGGRIVAENADDGGLRMTISLPRGN